MLGDQTNRATAVRRQIVGHIQHCEVTKINHRRQIELGSARDRQRRCWRHQTRPRRLGNSADNAQAAQVGSADGGAQANRCRNSAGVGLHRKQLARPDLTIQALQAGTGCVYANKATTLRAQGDLTGTQLLQLEGFPAADGGPQDGDWLGGSRRHTIRGHDAAAVASLQELAANAF